MVLKSARKAVGSCCRGRARQLKHDHPAGPKRGFLGSCSIATFQEVLDGLGSLGMATQHRHCVCQEGATSPESGRPGLPGPMVETSLVFSRPTKELTTLPFVRLWNENRILVQTCHEHKLVDGVLSRCQAGEADNAGRHMRSSCSFPTVPCQSEIKLQALKVTEAGMGLAKVGSEINTKKSQDGVPHKQPDMSCRHRSSLQKKSRINTSQWWWDVQVSQIHVPFSHCNLRMARMAPHHP